MALWFSLEGHKILGMEEQMRQPMSGLPVFDENWDIPAFSISAVADFQPFLETTGIVVVLDELGEFQLVEFFGDGWISVTSNKLGEAEYDLWVDAFPPLPIVMETAKP